MEMANRLPEEFLDVLRSEGEVLDEEVWYRLEVSPVWTLLLSAYPGGAEFRFERIAGEPLIHSERFLLQERLEQALERAGAPSLLRLGYEEGAPFLLGELRFSLDQAGLERFRTSFARMLGAVDFVEGCLEGKIEKGVDIALEETKADLTLAAILQGLFLDEVGPGKYTVADDEDPEILWGRLSVVRRLDNSIEAAIFVLLPEGREAEGSTLLSSLKDDMGFLRKDYDPWFVDPEAGLGRSREAFLLRAIGESAISEEALGALLAHASSLWSFLSSRFRHGRDLVDPANWRKAGVSGAFRSFLPADEDKHLSHPLSLLKRAVGGCLSDYDALEDLEGTGEGFSFRDGEATGEILLHPSSSYCPLVSYALKERLPQGFDPRAIPDFEKELRAMNAFLPYAGISLEGTDGRTLVLRSHAIFPEKAERKWKEDGREIVSEMMKSLRLLRLIPSILKEERPWLRMSAALFDLSLYEPLT